MRRYASITDTNAARMMRRAADQPTPSSEPAYHGKDAAVLPRQTARMSTLTRALHLLTGAAARPKWRLGGATAGHHGLVRLHLQA